MNLEQKILARLDQLIETGEEILQSEMQPGTVDSEIHSIQTFDLGPADAPTWVGAITLATQWGANCVTLIGRVFGTDSQYFDWFSHKGRSIDYVDVATSVAMLKAAKDDYTLGMLFDARAVIQAEVFDDFLEQAEHLLQQGYYQPAAVVAGAVLEDGLRKLCSRKAIALPDAPKLDRMNADLAKAGVYNRLWQKNITALADLRNKAAHGQWEQFTEADVKNMLQQVRSFMATHFS